MSLVQQASSPETSGSREQLEEGIDVTEVHKASFEERISLVADEILIEFISRRKDSAERNHLAVEDAVVGKKSGQKAVWKKKGSSESVVSAIKKLSYEEKCKMNKKLFNEHIKEDNLLSKDIVYSCQTCVSFTPTIIKDKALKHAVSHGVPKKRKRGRSVQYDCSFCDEKSTSKGDFVKHYQAKHCEKGLSKLRCTKCFQEFGSLSGLSDHIRLVHGKQDKEICAECGNSFKTRRLLTKHVNVVHNAMKMYTCDICDKSYRDSFNLKRHVSSHTVREDESQPIVPTDITTKAGTACPLCIKVVKKLTKHLRSSHSVDKDLKPTFIQLKFECGVCGKPFRDKCNLERNKPSCPPRSFAEFSCELCHMCVSSKSTLMRHVKEIHEVARTCEKCNKLFEDKLEYYNHLPCKCICKFCGKIFPTQWRFERHKQCCKVLKSRDDLQRSQFHNVISYQCFICGLGDIDGNDVRNHIEESHTQSLSEAFRCGDCDLDIIDVYSHICDNHVSIRRLRKSYRKSELQAASSGSGGLIFAKKSKPPIDEEAATVSEFERVEENPVLNAETGTIPSNAENGIMNAEVAVEVSSQRVHITLKSDGNSRDQPKNKSENPEVDPDDPETDDDLMNSEKGPVRIIRLGREEVNKYGVINKKEILVSTDDEEDYNGEDGEEFYEDVEEAMENDPEAQAWLNNHSATAFNNDDEQSKTSVEDSVIDSILDCESMEKRRKLDLLDEAIEVEAKLVVARDQESASSRLKLENLINKLEENRKRSRTRAERKRLFYQSAGARQSLFYKQIWSPFTDDQHGEHI